VRFVIQKGVIVMLTNLLRIMFDMTNFGSRPLTMAIV